MVEKYEARCLNCRRRFEVERAAEVAVCNHCGSKWRISWITPEQPKVQGPA
jgi:rRNA maturation endonuclease Nob1